MVQLYSLPKRHYSSTLKLFTHALTLVLLLAGGSVFSQDLVIKGKVTDTATGEGLPGVNIILKGTSNGTTTDGNGNYSITTAPDGVLVISFIGYASQEVAINNQTSIDIALESSAELLSEVVVVGYGSVEKKDVTGGIAKVNAEDFNKGLVNGVDQLIAGKVAGLQIVNGADPGAGSSIRLRGVSLNGQTPLFVIDGIPLDSDGGGVVGGRNPLSSINPSDIQDVTVLKDAAASAIYGARGANGVIIITTKSGRTGKLKVSYDGFYSASLFTRKPDFLSPADFRAAIAAKQPQIIDQNLLGPANTEWMDEVTQMAQSTQHTVSLSGGKSKTNYFGSVNYTLNNGVLRATQNRRLNLSLKVDQKFLNDQLKVTLNTKNTFTRDLYGPNVLGTAAGFDPSRSIKNADGTYFQWPDPLAPANPVGTQELNDNRGKTFRTLTNLSLQYDMPMVKGLSLKANFGLDYTTGEYIGITYPEEKEGPSDAGGGKLEQEETKTNKINEYLATYKNTFQKHGVEATVGYAWQNFDRKWQQISGDSLALIDGEFESTYLKDTINDPIENRLISYFGRVNYEYDGKYLLSASLRRDGSTKFGPSTRWGLFPAVAVAWRILEEDFASGLSKVFNELKLRVSYGVTGNEQIPSYLYSTYYYSSDNYSGASYQFGNDYVPTIRPTGVDPNIKWEETVSTNIGIDAGFFGGRLTGSLDFYNKDVKDLLFRIVVPAGSNLSERVWTNIGEVNNKGVELILNGVAYEQPNFKWNLSYNVSYNKNEVTKLDNLSGESLRDFPGYENGGISGDVGQTIQRRKVGAPVDAFYVYEHRKNADGSLVLDTDGDGVQESLEMYVDQLTVDTNGDGVPDAGDNIINENDLIIYKKPNPDVIMGLTSNMTYKKWDLAFTLKASFGNYVYNNVASANGFFDRLTEGTSINNIHSSAFEETNFNTRQTFSNYYVQNASFLKLTNISLGYNFDDFSFGKVRAYLTAQNVLTVSGYKGVDPEIFNGIDNNLYPRSITVSLGVGVTFK